MKRDDDNNSEDLYERTQVDNLKENGVPEHVLSDRTFNIENYRFHAS